MASAIIEPSANIAESLCFMAIELSKAKWLIGMLTPLANKISLRSIPCGAVQELLEFVERTTDKVLRATGRPVRIVSCYEAGYDGFWLHRVLDARGIINHIIEAASVHVSQKARRAKTENRLRPWPGRRQRGPRRQWRQGGDSEGRRIAFRRRYAGQFFGRINCRRECRRASS